VLAITGRDQGRSTLVMRSGLVQFFVQLRELASVNATKKANKTLIPTRAHAFIPAEIPSGRISAQEISAGDLNWIVYA
jgi:hypothetical protein